MYQRWSSTDSGRGNRFDRHYAPSTNHASGYYDVQSPARTTRYRPHQSPHRSINDPRESSANERLTRTLDAQLVTQFFNDDSACRWQWRELSRDGFGGGLFFSGFAAACSMLDTDQTRSDSVPQPVIREYTYNHCELVQVYATNATIARFVVHVFENITTAVDTDYVLTEHYAYRPCTVLTDPRVVCEIVSSQASQQRPSQGNGVPPGWVEIGLSVKLRLIIP